VGVRVTSHSYWKHGDKVQSTLGIMCSQLSWENRGNSYGEIRWFFTLSIGMKNKGRAGKQNTIARARMIGEFLIMLEHFGDGN